MPSVANPLTARMHKGVNTTCDEGQTMIPVAGGGFDVAAQPMAIQNATRGQDQNGLGVAAPGEPMYTLDGASQHAVAFAQNQRDEVRLTRLAGALASEPGMKQQTYVMHGGWAVRRLTPMECCRLQGFPDEYLSQVTFRGKTPPADGNMYKALGNSMAVPVIRHIGKKIMAAMK